MTTSLPAAGLAAALLVGPALAADEPALADLAFLAGAWRADWNGNVLEEHLSPPAHGTMIGMFRWTRDGVTGFTEHFVFEERNDGVHLFLRHFNPGLIPWEQEAQGPLHFRLTAVEEGRAVFEDPARSFPSHLVYHRVRPDTLIARLEGRDESGEDRTMEFTYRSTTMPTVATESLTRAGQSMGYDGGLTISLPVKNLQRAIDFYQDVVGFKLQYKLEEMGWCELTTSIPGVNVGLSEVEKPDPGGQTPTFGVKDIDHARRQLEKKGVKFDGETIEIPEMVKLATFYDPDGNPIKLYQSLSDELP